jgi:SH3 domain protein
MIRKILQMSFVIYVLATGPALAAHVTDKLLAGMYPAPKSQGKPLKLLSSGTPVEVLERGEVFHKVRIEDGAEGWVNSAYLTDETPARSLLVEAQSRIAELEQRLTEASSAVVECPDSPSSPAQEASVAEAVDAPAMTTVPEVSATDCSEITDELAALERKVIQAADLLGGVSAAPAKVDVGGRNFSDWRANWHWYAIPVALLAGLVLGIAWMDHRARQRYGGVRV